MKPPSLRSYTDLATDKPHGVRIRYKAGCRCLLCRASNSQYEAERAAARKSGDWNGIVSADKARKHLQGLRRAGIGRWLASEASGIARTVIQQVRSGKKKFIRARTERQILSVDRHAKNAASLVPAKETWKLIGELLEEGYSAAELAKRLGYRSRKIQFNRKLVTAKTEKRVAQLYRSVMEND